MYDDYDDFCLCSECGGRLMELGTLGNLTHLRCRNCGAEFSEKTTPVTYAGENEEQQE